MNNYNNKPAKPIMIANGNLRLQSLVDVDSKINMVILTAKVRSVVLTRSQTIELIENLMLAVAIGGSRFMD